MVATILTCVMTVNMFGTGFAQETVPVENMAFEASLQEETVLMSDPELETELLQEEESGQYDPLINTNPEGGELFDDPDQTLSSGSNMAQASDAVFETEGEMESGQSEYDAPLQNTVIPEPEMPLEEIPEEGMAIMENEPEEESETEEGFLFQAAGAYDGANDEITGTTGRNGTLLNWSLRDGVLTVRGQGAMDDYCNLYEWGTNKLLDVYDPEWKPYADQIKEVIIEEGVTRAGMNAFSNLDNLEKVTIAGSVKEIRSSAFSNNVKLTEINLSEGIQKLGSNAFYYANVTELKLPVSLRELDVNALGGLYSLQNYQMDGSGVYRVEEGILYTNDRNTLVSFPVARTGSFTVPANVRTIGEYAFIYAEITQIHFPESLVEIKSGAFTWSKIEDVTIPGSVKKIDDSAFLNARQLRRVVIENGTTEIGDNAFECDSSLTEVLLPESLEKIGSYVFYGCQITTLRIPASVTSIGAKALEGVETVILEGDRLVQLENGAYILKSTLDVTAHEDYEGAFRILELTNQERANAGLAPLTMDASLLETAMLRSFETILLFSHERPNGQSCFSANRLMSGENIAGHRSPEEAFTLWMNSDGHRGNILTSRFQSIGVGCVRYGRFYYCVQCFGTQVSAQAFQGNYTSGEKTRTIIYDQTKYPNLKDALLKAIGNDGNAAYDNAWKYDLGTVSDEGWDYDDYITISSIPTGVKVKAEKNGKVTVSWKQLKKNKRNKASWKKIKRIEIQYSTDPDFKTNVINKKVGKKKEKLQLKRLKKNAVYYVRIRYTDGAGGYSNWSRVRTVKIKNQKKAKKK